MSTSSLRRQVKNIVHNYSEAEIKVREATSNDPWGPSSSLMCEISDLTYNVVAFTEIMGMVWRRLNDHGKNWRHVYKALTLAEYLVKTGSERVAQQCRENIYAVQTLKDFQYIDRDGKDQGVNVREKAKQLVALLKDEEKLKEERAHALKTKEKLAQAATASSSAPSAPSATLRGPPDMEQAWPQSSGEEELQLQLALAMSKEEAEQRSPPVHGEDLQMQLALSLSKEEHDKEERLRRGDDLRLQMAIEESQRQTALSSTKEKNSLMDLADVFTAPLAQSQATDPWGAPVSEPVPPGIPTADPWGSQQANITATCDPWGGPQQAPGPPPPQGTSPDSWDVLGVPPSATVPTGDPWAPIPAASPPGHTQALQDPWAPSNSPPSTVQGTGLPPSDPFLASTIQDDFSEFDSLRSSAVRVEPAAGEAQPRAETSSPDLLDLCGLGPALPSTQGGTVPPVTRRTPESFLGPNAALVNLDTLVSKPTPRVSNPFLNSGGPSNATTTNPFGSTATATPAMTLNQLRVSPVPTPTLSPLVGAPLPPPTTLGSQNGFGHPPAGTTNPFLL
ncbi:epsin-1 isoform X1 [Hemitrygon akajei]|uniref:epsin-1 isoform X1 n=1 Tax=Hemitrygon akajei TaxID=2704970 RepID=UPI003BF94EC4